MLFPARCFVERALENDTPKAFPSEGKVLSAAKRMR